MLNEYTDEIDVELLGLIAFSKATANGLIERRHDQTIRSEHGEPHTSFNNVNGDQQQVEPLQSVINEETGSRSEVQSNGVPIIKPTRLPEIPLPTFYGDILNGFLSAIVLWQWLIAERAYRISKNFIISLVVVKEMH